MKKSKIIVPALAVLCLSTAAAVSGTVAWFSAGREASVSVQSTVINPEGDLECTIVAGTATTALTTGVGVTMAQNSMLRDASVDLGTTAGSFAAYRAIVDGEGNPQKYEAVTAANTSTVKVNNVDTTVYYFATFKMQFSIPQAAASAKYDLFFNPAKSSYTLSTTATDDQNNVQSAYRVGMYTSTKLCVWAPLQSAGASLTYVNGLTTSDVATYTNVSAGKITNDSKTTAQASEKYLGQMEGKNALEVNVVVWYEGSDSNTTTEILDALQSNAATYSMAFNAIALTDYLA